MLPTLKIKTLPRYRQQHQNLKRCFFGYFLGEIHIIMGQNGSGKSTALSVLMGNPKYTVAMGSVSLDKKNILDLSPTQRAQAGLF